jgi:hypothetical protein
MFRYKDEVTSFIMVSRLEWTQHRNTFVSKVKGLSLLAAVILLYIICLFGFHSEQSYPNAIRTNVLKSQDEWMERYYRLQFYEIAHNMNRVERSRLNKQVKEALQLWQYNRTSVMLFYQL